MTEKEAETEQKNLCSRCRSIIYQHKSYKSIKMEKEQSLVEQMRPQVDAVIADIIKDFKYTLVLNKPMVVFSKPEDDITDLVVKRLDAMHAKSAK